MGGNLIQELVFQHPDRVKAMVFEDCTWNFQKLTGLETFTLKIAEPLLNLYSENSLIEQSLKAATRSEEGRELLRRSMRSSGKQGLIKTLLATSLCLHYEPGYKIGKPILMVLGDKDATGNIRKVMPIWAKQEPDCKLVIFPDALHSPNLDDPEIFHKTLMEFLVSRGS
jgi:3-oxoadipate enol-lactonase